MRSIIYRCICLTQSTRVNIYCTHPVPDSDPDKIFESHGLSPSATIEELWNQMNDPSLPPEQIYMFEYIRDHRPLYERYVFVSYPHLFFLSCFRGLKWDQFVELHVLRQTACNTESNRLRQHGVRLHAVPSAEAVIWGDRCLCGPAVYEVYVLVCFHHVFILFSFSGGRESFLHWHRCTPRL